MPSLPLRSLQARILAPFILLVVLVQVGGYVLINTVGVAAARKSVGAEVVAGARVFDRFLEQDTERLVQGARLLTADYAFRETVATRDRSTIASVLANHGKRIDAALMLLVGLDRTVLADTSGGTTTGQRFAFTELLDRAGDAQQAAAMVVLNGELYQLVMVPVLAPLPVAWLAVGFRVDDALARDLRRLTGLQVSFLTRAQDGSWRAQASTLSAVERIALVRDIDAHRFTDNDRNGNADDGDEAITRVLDLSTRAAESVVAVLQQPLALALEPYWHLQRRLMLISLVGVIISIIASIAIARSIGRPVRDLAGIARRIAAGDYSTALATSRNDEIGDLAAAFRTMQEGILSRESRITDLAYRDALTGLPNRALFADRLDQALALSARAGNPLTVLLMDLDRFRYVNDTLGHPIGDLLLREVAARLQAVVQRKTDTVARLGGDEFAILLPNASVGDAQRVAEAILRVLEAPMTLEGHVVDIHASIGLSTCPDHGNEPVMLLRHADVAMYEAKRSNRGIAVWDDRYYQHSVQRLSLMSDLRKAVDNDELALVYQPKVGLGVVVEHHVEALVRWQHPTRGLVPPSEFIPFAEQTGYIRAITQWVIGHAVAQCAAWRSRGLPMNVSINLSARDLSDLDLPERLEALLLREHCAAQWISFEITESAILDDPGHAIRNLERLAALGCKLAIDDYGTGYSSLAYLRRLPVHELKIDKVFVLGLADDANNEIIVRSTIDLGHNMGLVVVAEGVEDAATLDRLRALRCDMIQGFFISRPLAAGDVERWVRESAWTHLSPERKALRRVGLI
ncbi:MAG: EAL domain-containing protein [Burkholderiales bacterium]